MSSLTKLSEKSYTAVLYKDKSHTPIVVLDKDENL